MVERSAISLAAFLVFLLVGCDAPGAPDLSTWQKGAHAAVLSESVLAEELTGASSITDESAVIVDDGPAPNRKPSPRPKPRPVPQPEPQLTRAEFLDTYDWRLPDGSTVRGPVKHVDPTDGDYGPWYRDWYLNTWTPANSQAKAKLKAASRGYSLQCGPNGCQMVPMGGAQQGIRRGLFGRRR